MRLGILKTYFSSYSEDNMISNIYAKNNSLTVKVNDCVGEGARFKSWHIWLSGYMP